MHSQPDEQSERCRFFLRNNAQAQGERKCFDMSHPIRTCLFTLIFAAVSSPAWALSVADFGAYPNDGISDSQAIQAAIDHANSTEDNTVYFPAGEYKIDQMIDVWIGSYNYQKPLRITGDWPILRATGPMFAVMRVHTTGLIKIERFLIMANNLATHGLYGYKMSGRNAMLSQVKVQDARSHGVLLKACQGAVFNAVSSINNGGDGFHILGSNASQFESCSASGNRGSGFHASGLVDTVNYSGGCRLAGVHSEGNRGHGVSIEANPQMHNYEVNGFVVDGGWLEGNRGDGVHISAWNVRVENLKILGGGVQGTKAVRLTSNAKAARVEGLAVGPNLVAPYGAVYVEAPGQASWHHAEANYYLYSGAPLPKVQGP